MTIRLLLALKIRHRWICPGRILTVGSIAPLTSSGVKRSLVSASGITRSGKSHGSLPLLGPGAEVGKGTDWRSWPHSSVLWIIISRWGTLARRLSRPPSTTIAPDRPAKI